MPKQDRKYNTDNSDPSDLIKIILLFPGLWHFFDSLLPSAAKARKQVMICPLDATQRNKPLYLNRFYLGDVIPE